MTTIDITAALLQQTEVNKFIQENIKPLLLGNEKAAHLQSARVDLVNSTASVTIDVRCRNKQRTCVHIPFNGRECFTLYEDNFTVTFNGVIPNSQQCSISSFSVTSANAIWQVLAAVANILANEPTIKDYLVKEICSQIPLALAEELAPALFTINTDQCSASLGQPVIACEIPVGLTDFGKTQFLEETFGIVADASAKIHVKFNKSDLLGRVIRNGAITVPPQHIDATLTTNGGPVNIDFLVAPSINFSDEGKATSASIGLSNISGIPAFLGAILARYVNTSQDLSSAIVNLVNDALGA